MAGEVLAPEWARQMFEQRFWTTLAMIEPVSRMLWQRLAERNHALAARWEREARAMVQVGFTGYGEHLLELAGSLRAGALRVRS